MESEIKTEDRGIKADKAAPDRRLRRREREEENK